MYIYIHMYVCCCVLYRMRLLSGNWCWTKRRNLLWRNGPRQFVLSSTEREFLFWPYTTYTRYRTTYFQYVHKLRQATSAGSLWKLLIRACSTFYIQYLLLQTTLTPTQKLPSFPITCEQVSDSCGKTKNV